MPVSVGTPLLWIGFTVVVVGMLLLDLGVFHRKAHDVTAREAAIWTTVWVSLALLFAGGIYFWVGREKALEFLTGYVIEEALSVDNIFVFIVIFSYFSVPKSYQHRVLFWGILGAMVMRGIFIFVGAALLSRFHWVMYVFGGFLFLTGIKILLQKESHMDPEKKVVFRIFRKVVPMTSKYHGQKFLVKEGAKWVATPLLLVLVMIEATDVLFAVDSIPAIFAVTRDPFIVYTSNIFAILGLRSLYFLLASVVDKFRYLKFGLGSVLMFVGVKMCITDIYKIPVGISLGVIASLLGLSVLLSFLIPELDSNASEP